MQPIALYQRDGFFVKICQKNFHLFAGGMIFTTEERVSACDSGKFTLIYRTKRLTILYDFIMLVMEGDESMSITATELKANLGKYLLLAATEDVFITQYGKVIAKLTNPYQERIDIATSLFGILPQTTTFEEAREERLNEK